MKMKRIKVDRFADNGKVSMTETDILPVLLEPAFKDIVAYQKALRAVSKAEGKLNPHLVKAIKSKEVSSLVDCGSFLNKIHVTAARFFFERVYQLKDKKK